MGDPVVEARGVTKRFGSSVVALDHVDLSLSRGSVTALVGPNGAGKTTLIRLCLGFERPTSGSIEVCGIDPTRNRAGVIRCVGYVPQASALHRSLSARDHFSLCTFLRPGFDSALALRRLDDLGIDPRRPVGKLSGGQQAQVMLAIALGTRAHLLLLDEPLANLDPLARRDFLQVLASAVKETAASVLLASHIISDVEEACSDLAIVGAGRLLLHMSLEAARSTHYVGEGSAASAGSQTVASFAGPDGERLTLVTLPAGEDATGLRRASLEEVALGYLSVGRALESGDAA